MVLATMLLSSLLLYMTGSIHPPAIGSGLAFLIFERSFQELGLLLLAVLILLVFGFTSCKETPKKTEEIKEEIAVTTDQKPFFELSLAQWSLNRAIRNGGMDPYTFAAKSKELGFSGLEYVSGLYSDLREAKYSEEAMANFVAKSNAEAKKHGMTNVLIMIDGQGNLATADAEERKKALGL